MIEKVGKHCDKVLQPKYHQNAKICFFLLQGRKCLTRFLLSTNALTFPNFFFAIKEDENYHFLSTSKPLFKVKYSQKIKLFLQVAIKKIVLFNHSKEILVNRMSI